MKFDKTKLLQIILILGTIYFLIGAIAHFFGLTIFPFYDSKLYTPYHDTVIALSAIIFAIFLFTIAKNPIKNIDILKVVVIGSIIAIIFNIYIILNIDFISLGAPAKKFQTVVETILLIIFVILLLVFKPKKIKQSK